MRDPIAAKLVAEGLECLDMDDVDAAGRYFRAALWRDSGNADAHNGLGMVRMRQGNLDRGLAAFREALRLDPGHGAAAFNLLSLLTELGLLHLEHDRLTEANAALTEAFGSASSVPDCGAALGDALYAISTKLYQEGQLKEALRTVSMAAIVMPGDSRVREHLGVLKQALGPQVAPDPAPSESAEPDPVLRHASAA